MFWSAKDLVCMDEATTKREPVEKSKLRTKAADYLLSLHMITHPLTSSYTSRYLKFPGTLADIITSACS